MHRQKNTEKHLAEGSETEQNWTQQVSRPLRPHPGPAGNDKTLILPISSSSSSPPSPVSLSPFLWLLLWALKKGKRPNFRLSVFGLVSFHSSQFTIFFIYQPAFSSRRAWQKRGSVHYILHHHSKQSASEPFSLACTHSLLKKAVRKNRWMSFVL